MMNWRALSDEEYAIARTFGKDYVSPDGILQNGMSSSEISADCA
jgi:hypothetical protein